MIAVKVLDILLEIAEELKISPSYFFTQNIPQSMVDTDETTVLVSEIHDIFTNRASDISTTKDSLVEIQIFYRGETIPDKTEMLINQQLEKHWFYQIDSYPDVDPDTGFLTRTMKYEHTEVI